MFKRLSVASFTLMVLFASYTLVQAAASRHAANSVPLLKDLENDARQAREKNIPVVIEFAMDNCPFCFQVEDEVLKPMLISGDYDHKVVIRKVMIDAYGDVIDINGKRIAIDDFAARYSIDVVPTLVIMDGYGRPLAKPMRGVTTIDFYGQYLDIAIDEALSKLNTGKQDQKAS